MIDELLADAREHMGKSVEATRGKFSSVRTGRASPNLLDRVTVDYYGAQTPLKQPHVNQDKYDGKTIEQLRTELAGTTGENVVIRRFARFEVGA